MTEQETSIISQVADIVKQRLEHERSGHDWWHCYRVWKLAQTIARQEEDVNSLIIELAALLHDIADWKDYGGDESIGPKTARMLLEQQGVSEEVISHVADIIGTMSFKGAGVMTPMKTIEGMIVQDADRLDAIGAIGVARVFAYGGNKGKKIYDPDCKPSDNQTKEEYFTNNNTSINHFYEKLLLVKDRMNTDTAKRMAEHRHRYLEDFLKEFYAEWGGER